jgi:hypothetical protein
MKIFLQNTGTKLYFCLPGVWTQDVKFAFNFRHSDRALEFARQNEMTSVQVVVKFPEGEWSKVAPVPVQVATVGRLANA